MLAVVLTIYLLPIIGKNSALGVCRNGGLHRDADVRVEDLLDGKDRLAVI